MRRLDGRMRGVCSVGRTRRIGIGMGGVGRGRCRVGKSNETTLMHGPFRSQRQVMHCRVYWLKPTSGSRLMRCMVVRTQAQATALE